MKVFARRSRMGFPREKDKEISFEVPDENKDERKLFHIDQHQSFEFFAGPVLSPEQALHCGYHGHIPQNCVTVRFLYHCDPSLNFSVVSEVPFGRTVNEVVGEIVSGFFKFQSLEKSLLLIGLSLLRTSEGVRHARATSNLE